MSTIQSQIIKKVKRVVIKIGSGLITSEKGFSTSFFKALAKEIQLLRHQKIEVVLVSSGAVACGMNVLGLKRRPSKTSQKQAISAIGQPLLMQHFSKIFGKKIPVAQVLLTREGLDNRSRFLMAKNSVSELLKYNVLPIVNENDTVAVDEIQIGDNDQLSAMVTHLIDADLLIILSDIDAFYSEDPKKNPQATRLAVVKNVTEQTFKKASDTQSPISVGGMRTKLIAAQQAATYGVPTWLLNGQNPQNLKKAFQGEDIGTLFLPRRNAISRRKYWILHGAKKASIIIDKGASKALVQNKKSLLPSGVVDVQGRFNLGDSITVLDEKGLAIAKGLAKYSSEELERIKGQKSSSIEKILGYKYDDEVIHRDDMVML